MVGIALLRRHNRFPIRPMMIFLRLLPMKITFGWLFNFVPKKVYRNIYRQIIHCCYDPIKPVNVYRQSVGK